MENFIFCAVRKASDIKLNVSIDIKGSRENL